MQSVGFANPRILLGKAMQHDVTAGRDSQFLCRCGVLQVRIGDVKCLVIVAVWIPRVEYIGALGCAMVSLSHLGSNWFAAQGDAIRLQFPASELKDEFPLVLVDDDPVDSSD